MHSYGHTRRTKANSQKMDYLCFPSPGAPSSLLLHSVFRERLSTVFISKEAVKLVLVFKTYSLSGSVNTGFCL